MGMRFHQLHLCLITAADGSVTGFSLHSGRRSHSFPPFSYCQHTFTSDCSGGARLLPLAHPTACHSYDAAAPFLLSPLLILAAQDEVHMCTNAFAAWLAHHVNLQREGNNTFQKKNKTKTNQALSWQLGHACMRNFICKFIIMTRQGYKNYFNDVLHLKSVEMWQLDYTAFHWEQTLECCAWQWMPVILLHLEAGKKGNVEHLWHKPFGTLDIPRNWSSQNDRPQGRWALPLLSHKITEALNGSKWEKSNMRNTGEKSSNSLVVGDSFSTAKCATALCEVIQPACRHTFQFLCIVVWCMAP